MGYWEKKLIREQIEKKLAVLRDFDNMGMPESGWIKAIREALGMTTTQMAARTGFDQSRISRLENAEKDGSLKLSSMQKIARGLGMRLVYGFVAEKSLEQIVRDQAKNIAVKRLKRLDDTMSLESQGLSLEEQQQALADMMEKILIEDLKDFWDDEKYK